jgi:hypothetical protein
MLLDIYWNILTMHGPMNGKSPNNTSKWQMEFNSAFKGLTWKSVLCKTVYRKNIPIDLKRTGMCHTKT